MEIENEIETENGEDEILMTDKEEKRKFKIKLDVYPECNEDDIKESIENNFLGALEDINIIDEESKILLLK